jgi:DNA-binding LacI/PurR family transcriptional regulator
LVQMLIQIIGGRQPDSTQILLPTTLVVRESSALRPGK